MHDRTSGRDDSAAGPAARLAAEHGRAAGRARLEAMLAQGRLRILDGGGGRHIVHDRDYADHLDILLEIERRAAAPTATLDAAAVAAGIAAATDPLTEEQVAAMRGIAGNRISIVHGKPGTGKSTVVKAAAAALRAASPAQRALVAAFSARIAVATGHRSGLPGVTLHSLTGTKPGSMISRGDPLDPGLAAIFVDEAFSVDPPMLLRILRQAHWDTRIALLGDPGQMLPIGGGRSLHDALDCAIAPCFGLLTPQRLATSRHLDAQLDRIAAGHAPLAGPGLRIHRTDGPGEHSDRAKAALAVRLLLASRARGLSCVVLTATQYGRCGHVAINRLVAGGHGPRQGDEVITTAADRDGRWRNGERGVVTARAGTNLSIAFDDGRAADADVREPSIALAYAMSGHRGQGLEYDRAIVVLDRQHAGMLGRRYIASTISRAAECTVITDPGLLEYACGRDDLAGRAPVLRSIAANRAAIWRPG